MTESKRRKLISSEEETDSVSRTARQVVRATQERCIEEEKGPVEFLHSGSIVLNLAGSGKGSKGGWARGRIVNFVGDGSSGKTALALELCAHAYYRLKSTPSSLFPPVKNVRIIYDNAEGVMDFPLQVMFGEEFVEAVEWTQSSTVEEFGRRFTREVQAHKEGTALIYVVDSLDALPSAAQKKRFLDAAKRDKEEDASYGGEKAKYLSSSFFGNLCDEIKGKDITLVVISQVRQNIGVMFGEKYYRAGGKALDFYTHQVCWLAEIEKLKKTYHGHDRVYGIRVRARFKRNKVAKPFRDAEFIILFDYGIDDIGSTLAWVYGPKVESIEWNGQKYSRPDLIAHIESSQVFQQELADMAETLWREIEENVKPDRSPKF